jgi:hypothetical protein
VTCVWTRAHAYYVHQRLNWLGANESANLHQCLNVTAAVSSIIRSTRSTRPTLLTGRLVFRTMWRPSRVERESQAPGTPPATLDPWSATCTGQTRQLLDHVLQDHVPCSERVVAVLRKIVCAKCSTVGQVNMSHFCSVRCMMANSLSVRCNPNTRSCSASDNCF